MRKKKYEHKNIIFIIISDGVTCLGTFKALLAQLDFKDLFALKQARKRDLCKASRFQFLVSEVLML